MQNDPQFPRPIEAFLVIIASFILILIFTQTVIWVFLPGPPDFFHKSLGMKILISAGEIGLIVVPLLYIKRRNLALAQAFRWKAIPLPMVIWSIIIGFSISIVGDELDRLMSLIIPAPEFLAEISQAMRINTPADFIILVIGAVLAAAVVEESIIRGFLQNSLEKHLDVTRAVIYASLAWTIIHGMLFWAIQIFLMGIILGLLAWRSNSIVPSAIGHAINNAAALVFYNTNHENLKGIYLWGEHVSPLFLLLALAGLIYGVRTFYRFYQKPPDFPVSRN